MPPKGEKLRNSRQVGDQTASTYVSNLGHFRSHSLLFSEHGGDSAGIRWMSGRKGTAGTVLPVLESKRGPRKPYRSSGRR
ncbi:MAG: hypothetical protein K0Q72_884 [Armatimonadetes bacterium]|jgi:hypothetical protein|nr:hypothetical protein [Armatimonadota bacterium]